MTSWVRRGVVILVPQAIIFIMMFFPEMLVFLCVSRQDWDYDEPRSKCYLSSGDVLCENVYSFITLTFTVYHIHVLISALAGAPIAPHIMLQLGHSVLSVFMLTESLRCPSPLLAHWKPFSMAASLALSPVTKLTLCLAMTSWWTPCGPRWSKASKRDSPSSSTPATLMSSTRWETHVMGIIHMWSRSSGRRARAVIHAWCYNKVDHVHWMNMAKWKQMHSKHGKNVELL